LLHSPFCFSEDCSNSSIFFLIAGITSPACSNNISECKIKDGKLKHKSTINVDDIKIAFVGNWKMRCGIATYAENLWPEVAKHFKNYNF
jgi:hypothetical protein